MICMRSSPDAFSEKRQEARYFGKQPAIDHIGGAANPLGSTYSQASLG